MIIPDLFVGKVSVNQVTDCWEWTGSKTPDGYGKFGKSENFWYAHRYSYTFYHGEIPDGLLVRHKCHNPGCCNPDHLVVGTVADNWRDSEERHRAVHQTKMKPITMSLNGLVHTYDCKRDMCEKTGLSTKVVWKYTENGVFNVEAYRASCIKQGRVPKI